MRLILDTGALIALRKGNPKVQRVLKERRDEYDELGVSRLTEYELRLGGNFLWNKYGDARELTWLDEVLDWLTIYEIDEDVIRDAAEVQAEAMANGQPFPDMDLLIALSGKSGSVLATLDDDQREMKESLKKKGVDILTLT